MVPAPARSSRRASAARSTPAGNGGDEAGDEAGRIGKALGGRRLSATVGAYARCPAPAGLCGALGQRVAEAQKAEQAGDLSSAATLYQERLKTHPDDLTAVKALAGIFYIERKWDEALPFQEKAVALDPKESQIRVELGFNYLNHQSRPADAVRVLQEAATIEPTAKYLAFLAQAQAAAGDLQGAEKTLRTALATDKSYPHTYTLLISLLDRQGRTAEAAELRSAAEAAGIALQTVETAQ